MDRWRGRGILAIVAALLLALPAEAAERVVVLELGNPAGLTDQEAQYLSDLVRGAVNETTGARYFVLTRENLLELLPPGTSLAACVGACEVETGRKVGADHVVSGEVVRFGAQLRASLRLHDTRSGRMVGMETASAVGLVDLEQPLEDAGHRLAGRLPGVTAAAAPHTAVAPKPTIVPGGTLAVAGFGTNLKVPEAPLGPAHFLPTVSPTTDEALLEKVQAAQRAESETPRSAAACVKAWRALADHMAKVAHPMARETAERAAAWEVTAKAAQARFLVLAQVRKKFEADRDSIRRYLALDDDTISRVQKTAFVMEFRQAWTWYNHIEPMPAEVETWGARPQSSPAPRPASRRPPATKSAPVARDETYWPPRLVMFLGVTGVAVGLLTTFIGGLENSVSGPYSYSCSESAEDDPFSDCTGAGNDTIDTGWTIVGLSGAATIAGGIWYLVHESSESKSKPKNRSGGSMGAAFGPNGLTVYGSF